MRFVVHVGYPKAGSTWLQKCLFPNANVDVFLNPVSLPLDHRKIRRTLLARDPRKLRRQSDLLMDTYVAIANNTGNDTATCLISDEEFIGQRGTHNRIQSSAAVLGSRQDVDAVLMVIRSQMDVIYSIYEHYVKQGGHKTPENFIRSQRLFDPRRFLYDRAISAYRHELNAVPLVVVPYEWLLSDTNSLLEHISTVVDGVNDDIEGTSFDEIINLSAGDEALRPVRIFNKVRMLRFWRVEQEYQLGGPWTPIARSAQHRLSKTARLYRGPAEWKQRIEFELERAGWMRSYRRSNEIACDALDLDLGELGYVMG